MAINEFTGPYRFLSNFYPSPIEYEGITYPTVEHAFQAAKTHSEIERKMIARLDTPGQAKQAGRAISLRIDWEQIKLGVMRTLLAKKFLIHEDLGHRLVETGTFKLIEGNWWHDNTWGSCGCLNCFDKPKNNKLGILLMERRIELQEQIKKAKL